MAGLRELIQLTAVLNDLRAKFPVVCVLCIPWISTKHPLHPVQEELLTGKPSPTRLSDTEAHTHWLMPVVHALMESRSLILRASLCAGNSIRLTIKLFQLKRIFQRELDRVKAAQFAVIAKTWCFGPERKSDDDFYYGDLQLRLASNDVSMLLLCGDANNSDWKIFAKSHFSISGSFRVPELVLAPMHAPLALAVSQIVTALRLRGHAYRSRDPLARRAARQASIDVLSPAVTQAGLIHDITRIAVRTWRPRAFLTLYEGHGWEKSAWWAAKQENRECRTVGYQHTVLFSTQLSMLQPFVDIRDRSVPDIVLALGNHTAALIDSEHRKYGVKTVRFGTFRRNVPVAPRVADPERRTVLVIPEGIVSEMEFLFTFAAQCAKIMPSYTFVLRAHPKWAPSKAVRNITDSLLGGNVTWSTGSIENDFLRSAVMLYRGSSTVLQGVLQGLLPVYVTIPGGTISDPISGLTTWRQVCSSPENFSDTVKRFESQHPDLRNEDWLMALNYVEDYIPPVNDESIKAFLQAIGNDSGGFV